jgi:hypothetical protein
MRRLGIDRQSRDAYEEIGNYWRGIQPAPLLSEAELNPVFPLELGARTESPRCIFREDHFDPTARIRRGRFYMLANNDQPSQRWALPYFGGEHYYATRKGDGSYERFLFIYDPYLPAPNDPLVELVGLGGTLWHATSSPERISTGEFLFILRARHNFGILPEVDPQKIPEAGRAKAIETLEALIDAAHRESPGSIIDRARDGTQWCLATWAADQFKEESLLREDLGSVIQKISKKREMVALRAAQIVQRLHSRVKPNEQERFGFRPPMEDDAELALKSVGFLVRELGWARD